MPNTRTNDESEQKINAERERERNDLHANTRQKDFNLGCHPFAVRRASTTFPRPRHTMPFENGPRYAQTTFKLLNKIFINSTVATIPFLPFFFARRHREKFSFPFLHF